MRIPVPDEILPADELGRVHFIGIGGAALSGIARIMASRGLPVTGSDDQDTPFLPSLRELGITCHLGYDADHLGDAETVVVTTAAREDNPEVLEARRRGLRILPRSAGLESVMQGQRLLAVAGTHGKTTTTALLTVALIEAGADPTYAVGECSARPAATPTPGRAAGSWLRPTSPTVRSSSIGPTPRSSPTSRPTTSTSGAPRRLTARPS